MSDSWDRSDISDASRVAKGPRGFPDDFAVVTADLPDLHHRGHGRTSPSAAQLGDFGEDGFILSDHRAAASSMDVPSVGQSRSPAEI